VATASTPSLVAVRDEELEERVVVDIQREKKHILVFVQQL
jgi:hypothetical protein